MDIDHAIADIDHAIADVDHAIADIDCVHKVLLQANQRRCDLFFTYCKTLPYVRLYTLTV